MNVIKNEHIEDSMNSSSSSGHVDNMVEATVDEQYAETKWHFENTKDTPLSKLSPAARDKFRQLDYSVEDYYDHFPCFTSSKSLGKFISLYECYKQTIGIAGHIAEMGVFRGASSLFFAKMALLYEPQSITQVHAFDWWREPEGDDEYYEPFERIEALVNVQGLQRYVLLHRMNILEKLSGFFKKNSHLQFKLVYLDAGEYEQTRKGIIEFWPRLTPGGIMILDQYNSEGAPGETQAVKELLPEDTVIRTFPNGWFPTAYIVKGEKI